MRLFAYLCLLLTWFSALAQEVPVLLSAKFSQGHPFNNTCPDLSATGCGPTAIAEILNLYKQPAHGYGDAILFLDFDSIPVNMESINFDWANILDSYVTGEYTDTQAKSVADLMYACGVAMRVDYGASTSVTNYAWMLWGLQHYLRMSPDSRYLHRKHYSTAEWLELLNEQLRSGHPVFYRGTWLFDKERADHMFAVDGLDSKGNYHINFGHAGKDDKFCNINVINQTGSYPGGKGVCYNASQAMVINCYPTPEFTDYPIQTCISEEAIILNEDKTLQRVEVSLGSPFTLSCRLRNCGMEKATITFGWALTKNGDMIEVLGQGKYTLSPGYTFKEASHRTIRLPKNLSDGEYKLVLYSKSNLESDWQEVWRDAATEVNIEVNGGVATVSIPPNHQLNPCLFLSEPIQEIENEFAYSTPGRAFALTINNNTVNNFENKIKLDIKAENQNYSYETVIPVYSQTSTPFHILVPASSVDFGNREISTVTAYYYYDLEDRYIEMTTEEPDGVTGCETERISSDIQIFDIWGLLIKTIKAEEIVTDYNEVISSLPNGIYIIKEGTRTRKLIK